MSKAKALFAKFSIYELEKDRIQDVLSAIKNNEAVFQQYHFTECKGSEKSKIGFVPTDFTDGYVSEVNGNVILKVLTQGKSINKHEINAYHKVKQFKWMEENNTDTIPVKTDKLLFEDAEAYVVSQTYPTEPKPHYLVFRPDGKVLVNGGGKSAEDLLGLCRKALGSLPAFPFEAEGDVTVMLKDRILDKIKDKFALTDEAEAIDQDGSKVKLKGEIYEATEFINLVKDPRAVMMKVGIEFDGIITTVLTEELVFEKVKYLKELIGDCEDDKAALILQLNETVKMVNATLELVKVEGEEA